MPILIQFIRFFFCANRQYVMSKYLEEKANYSKKSLRRELYKEVTVVGCVCSAHDIIALLL